MSTLLAQVEACLNSRPLEALTEDPDDTAALTPGHFLIGTALNAVPEPSLTTTPETRLTRWQLVQRMKQHFWDRWSREYLHSLNHRPKWWKSDTAVEVGRLCILRNENSPPNKWPLARVTHTHPGEDGHVRVVTVRTASSTFTRPVNRLILLPMQRDREADEQK
ncbi:hypothetical protein RF55_23670 [Lasius niger]|uniref:DUF5641 domain-containing protein n=1 Tax=Lasius niger TaxID=67767 RepID=A0A0J7JVS9_LASNI|nr:hypothetical protein RF55_23670 [Lasius niger]